MNQNKSKVFKQSGVIPYRVKEGKIEVLLITSRGKQQWVIPKGGICNGMSPADSAAKEAWEEAGVIGQVDKNELGRYKYRKQGKTYCVKIFSLPVEQLVEDYPEANHRQRQWVDMTQAITIVKLASLKRIFKQFLEQEQLFSQFQQVECVGEP